MEMALKEQRATRDRSKDLPVSVKEAQFTPDELAAIMREANSRQSSPAVATIDEALETARELGIDEKHVMDAARELQEKKIRRDVLRRRSKARLMKLVRFLGTMAFVVTLVWITAGQQPAGLAAFGMSIAAFVMAAQWVKALFEERFPPENTEALSGRRAPRDRKPE